MLDTGRLGDKVCLDSWRIKLTVGRAGLALAIVAVVVAGEQRGVDIDGIGGGLAQAVSGESHFEYGLADDLCSGTWI